MGGQGLGWGLCGDASGSRVKIASGCDGLQRGWGKGSRGLRGNGGTRQVNWE